MPILPEGFDWDLEEPGSRFTLRPAFALRVSEEQWPEWGEDSDERSRVVVADEVGPLLDEDYEELGRPRVVSGTFGRGASGWTPVVEWLFEPAAKGAVSAVAGAAALAVCRKFRRRDDDHDADHDEEREPRELRRLDVSRGMAALLTVAAVTRDFGDNGPFEIEAVEEPSSIAGAPVSELSYVGLEPWIVLLRNGEASRRYVAVVAPDGEVVGALRTRLGEWEKLFLPSALDTEAPGARAKRRKRWRRRRTG